MRLLMGALALFSSSALAAWHCNVTLQGPVSLQQEQLTVGLQAPAKAMFTAQQLFIDGVPYPLEPAQQQLAQAYYVGIKETAEEAAALGLKSLDSMHEGVIASLHELLGENAPFTAQLSQELTQLRQKISTAIYNDAGQLQFDFFGNHGNDWLDSLLDEPLQQKMQGILQRSLGGLMLALSAQAIQTGNFGQLEQKMADFSKQLEKDMAQQMAALEQQGDAICQKMKALDQKETRLSQSVPALAALNVIREQ